MPTEIVTSARRHGRLPYPVNDLEALLVELAGGHPVLVLQNLGLSWLPAWHYSVVIGYELSTETILLHSGLDSRKGMPFRLFDRTWERAGRWGRVVLPPHELPASAQEELYLEAVSDLEAAQQWRPAAQAYDAAARQWPDSLPAKIGLGNSLYSLGDLTGAESAFRRATTLHPNAAVAFNNLAHVLAEQGRTTEALAAARRALVLGGPGAHVYEQTLREIQSTKP
jgi:tetratricopeptide (TPR) repeat protein